MSAESIALWLVQTLVQAGVAFALGRWLARKTLNPTASAARVFALVWAFVAVAGAGISLACAALRLGPESLRLVASIGGLLVLLAGAKLAEHRLTGQSEITTTR